MGIAFRGGGHLCGAPGSQYHSAPCLRAASLCANSSSHLLKTGAFFSIVAQSPNHVRLFATPWTAARQASLSFTISQTLLKFMSVESVMPSHHLILCRPLLLLPSIFPSVRVFSSELALCIRWPKNWSFSISPSNEYSGLISFRIEWSAVLTGFSNPTQCYWLKLPWFMSSIPS